MQLLAQDEIKRLNKKSKEDYFIQLQRFILSNLELNDKKFYKENIQKIDTLEKRIKFITTFHEVALQNAESRKFWSFIEAHFPEKLAILKREYNEQFESERFFFLQNKIIKLEKALKSKLEDDALSLQEKLMLSLNERQYKIVVSELEKIETLEDKINYLKKSLNT